MKTYRFSYSSQGNFEKGDVHINACSILEANTKFFDWLIKQQLCTHMWQLSINVVETTLTVIE